MVRSLQNTFKILWPYILCGALVSTVWFVNWRVYFPITAMEMVRIEGVIYAVIVGNILYFSYKGIAEPQSLLQKVLLGLVALITLSLSGALGYKGWLLLEQQKVFFSFRYLYWLGDVLMVYSLPAFVSLLATFVALKNSLFSFGNKKVVEDEPYGSARLCSAQEAISKNDKKGLPLGRILTSVKGDDVNLIKKIKASKVGEIFRYDPIHTLLIAPSGSGKGVGFIIPTLLEYDGPVVVVDPKDAENFTVTARHRSKNGSRKVYAFDTNDITGQETAKINIFDFIDSESKKFVDQVKKFVASLCPSTGNKRDDFWIETGQDILTCLMIVVAQMPKNSRSLEVMYDLLMGTTEEFMGFLEEVASGEEDQSGAATRIAKKILSTEKKEFSGYLSTARNSLRFLDSPSFRNITSETNFEMEDIFENKADLFLCISNDEMESGGNYFIRMVIGIVTQQVKRREKKLSKSIIFLLDEMAAIGRVREVKNMVLLGRSYGMRLIGISQTIESLEDIYPKEFKTLLSSSLLMFQAIREPSELKYVADRFGCKTVFSESDSTSKNADKNQEGHTKSAVKREILTTDEIESLYKDYMIAFVEGSKPLVLKRLNYLEEKSYSGRFDRNNFH